MIAMTNKEFVAKAKDIANNYKTLYIMGCFGAPMGYGNNRNRYMNNNDYNKQPARQKMIKNASDDTFGFDCVCLLKGIMGGWNGNLNAVYGGVTVNKEKDGSLTYGTAHVPDYSTEGMIKACSGVSTDFSKIEVGEMLWLQGHAGIYIGDGLAVESTPAWKNKVQITAVANIGAKSGYNSRKWTKHGKLPWIDYKTVAPVVTDKTVKVELDVLKKGSKGYQVKTLQRLLQAIGYSLAPYGVDGDFGSITELAVKDYKSRNRLGSDGIVDQKTWDKLLKG